jgi:cholesterol transport system auxiliary component
MSASRYLRLPCRRFWKASRDPDGGPFRVARGWLALAMLCAVAGCTSLLGGGPPPHLYRVTAVRAFPPDLPHVPAQLLVEVPQAPAGLDTRRIALARSPVSLDYFADSEWTDRLPGLVQTALAYSFENSHAIIAVGRDAIGLRTGFALRSEIRHFEAEYGAADSAPIIRARIVAMLVSMPAGRIVANAAFAVREPAAANTIPAIVTAFNKALDTLMRQIVVWTVTNPALSTAPRHGAMPSP